MSELDLPLVIEPEQLEPLLQRDDLCILDLCKATTYQELHIPGAIFVDYNSILASRGKTHGLLPDQNQLASLFSSIGIDNNTHVIAYDDEGGGKAGRLLWTLEVMGHMRYSLLNGGLHAWANEGHPVTQEIPQPNPAVFHPNPSDEPVADAEYILAHLKDPDIQLLDARSKAEFQGTKRYAAKAGHIPGAINMDWLLALDQNRNMRLKPDTELSAHLHHLCLDPDKETIVYCHTHHRSSLSYIMLKQLGFRQIKGYPGSWSDWGNRNDTPTA